MTQKIISMNIDDIKYIESKKYFWMLLEEISSCELQKILSIDFSYMYLLNYCLVPNYERVNASINKIDLESCLISNCFSNVLIEKRNISSNFISFLKERSFNLLLTNDLIPDYLNYNEKKVDDFLMILNKQCDWKMYVELSTYNRNTEFFSKSESVLFDFKSNFYNT